MFITQAEIDHLKTVQEGQKQNMVGLEVYYYFLTNGGAGACGMPAVLVDARRGDGTEDAFFVDLAIETPVKGFYTHHKNLKVLSLTLERTDSQTDAGPALAKSDEVEALIDVVNGATNPTGSHLRLIK